MAQYSIVLIPPTSQIAYVKSKKDALFSTIGWYHSRNAKAHITVVEFEATERQLKKVIEHLETFCSMLKSFDVQFNSMGTLGTALCLMPSVRSKAILAAVMKKFIKDFPIPCVSSSYPHITIGRRLARIQLGLGQQRFASEKPDLAFVADALYLRKFNESRGQYDMFMKIDFGGEDGAMPIVVQPTLFD